MNRVREWHEVNLGIFRTGVAVLSRYPIEDARYREFTKHPFWDAKGYLSVRIVAPSGPLRFISIHMASTNDLSIRNDQWRELTAAVQELRAAGPVVLAGDFTAEPGDPAMAAFVRDTGAHHVHEGRPDLARLRSWTPSYKDDCASPADPDSALLDYVFVVPAKDSASPRLSLRDGRIVSDGRKPRPSDHCMVTATLLQSATSR
jgi:endonuclease/exonuclease/phosphatase family metal-dependent hydrolase